MSRKKCFKYDVADIVQADQSLGGGNYIISEQIFDVWNEKPYYQCHRLENHYGPRKIQEADLKGKVDYTLPVLDVGSRVIYTGYSATIEAVDGDQYTLEVLVPRRPSPQGTLTFRRSYTVPKWRVILEHSRGFKANSEASADKRTRTQGFY